MARHNPDLDPSGHGDWPACCGKPDAQWPLPQPLTDTVLVCAALDTAQFSLADFGRCGIELPARLAGAVRKRQGEFLAGRLCARAALQQLGCLALPSSHGEHGPRWPAGFCGSISHGKGMVGAICGRSDHWQSLGLDIEAAMALPQAERLAAQILTNTERQRFAQLPLAELISLGFSLKEALYKALNPLTGRFFYFHDAELLTIEPIGSARFRLVTGLSAQWPAGRELDAQWARQGQYYYSLVAVNFAGP